jgi:hypothetical protein
MGSSQIFVSDSLLGNTCSDALQLEQIKNHGGSDKVIIAVDLLWWDYI